MLLSFFSAAIAHVLAPVSPLPLILVFFFHPFFSDSPLDLTSPGLFASRRERIVAGIMHRVRCGEAERMLSSVYTQHKDRGTGSACCEKPMFARALNSSFSLMSVAAPPTSTAVHWSELVWIPTAGLVRDLQVHAAFGARRDYALHGGQYRQHAFRPYHKL